MPVHQLPSTRNKLMQTSGIAYGKMWSALGRMDEGTVTTYKSMYTCKQINICRGWHMELRIVPIYVSEFPRVSVYILSKDSLDRRIGRVVKRWEDCLCTIPGDREAPSIICITLGKRFGKRGRFLWRWGRGRIVHQVSRIGATLWLQAKSSKHFICFCVSHKIDRHNPTRYSSWGSQRPWKFRSGRSLFTMALREVDNLCTNRRQLDHTPSTRMP